MALVIALDIGGTFTDLVAFDLSTGTIHHAKSSTTPYDLAVGIRETLDKCGLPMADADTFIHGSTVAINTAIERSGARTALIVTQGMRDIYKIGRGNRPQAYNLFFKRPEPYVRRRDSYECVERLAASGDVLVAFDENHARKLVERLADENFDAVAVCFLHSWANADHETAMGNILDDALPTAYRSLSHEILREYREYERVSTTVLNAYVGPRVSRYLGDLEDLLSSKGFDGRILIMQSNGGSMSPATAKRIPVATMESGPVGGIIATAEVTRDLGYANAIAFDMGGTTAKVSLIQNNQPAIAQGYYIGGEASGHPVMLPVVDIIEVGAGGGSIAWIDEVGALKVGPKSAGGQPGPVCYGQGGSEPTVTDANVVLGRVGATRFLGGEMPLDVAAARQSIKAKIAAPLNLAVEEAALGIIKIAIATMSLAVRAISVGRGYDPRDFALVAIGGAGPVHAAEIARELYIPTVVVPRVPGHFSAFGMLLADLRHDYVQTYYKPLVDSDLAEIDRRFAATIAEAAKLLESEGAPAASHGYQLFLDLRYVGQEFPIQTPIGQAQLRVSDIPAIRGAFDEIHDRRFGHQAVNEPVEIVNIRLTATGKRERLRFPKLERNGVVSEPSHRDVVLGDLRSAVSCAVYDREQLVPGQSIDGPAVISEYASTTLLFEGDRLTVTETGELIIRIGAS